MYPGVVVVARAIAAVAQSEGDYQTAVHQMTLHRRDAPTEPLHGMYNLGLTVLAQGEKQTLLGRKSLTFRPGESMLTTIDVPAVSHVSRATAREPFLGVMLLLDARSVMQAAADLDLPAQPRRDDVSPSIAVHPVDAHLLDAFVRVLKVLGEPAMVPRLAPLILQEITIRLLTGPHAVQLRHLVTIGSPSQQIAKTIAPLHVPVLMRRHNERVYRMVRAIVGNDGRAEEVLQQRYVNAYANLRKFDSTMPFAIWLTRMAVNAAVSRGE